MFHLEHLQPSFQRIHRNFIYQTFMKFILFVEYHCLDLKLVKYSQFINNFKYLETLLNQHPLI